MSEVIIIIAMFIGFFLFAPFFVGAVLWFFEEVYGRYIDWVMDKTRL